MAGMTELEHSAEAVAVSLLTPPEQVTPGKSPDPLVRLQELFERQGADLKSGWTIEVKQRSGGSTAGTTDTYYRSPEGKRYRSRLEVARDYGLHIEPAPKKQTSLNTFFSAPKLLSHEEAVLESKKALESLKLPIKVANGMTINRLGTTAQLLGSELSPLPLLPIGFEACGIPVEDSKHGKAQLGVEIVEGPLCRVWVRLAAERLLLGEGSRPQTAWDHAVEKAHGEAKEKLPKAMIRQLSPGWALERFGLTSIRVLHAVEGLAAVANLSDYKYVDETVGWARKTADVMGTLVSTRDQSSKGSGKSGASHPSGLKKADANTVVKVVDSIVRKIERKEDKTSKAAERGGIVKRDSVGQAGGTKHPHSRAEGAAANAAAWKKAKDALAIREDQDIPGFNAQPPPLPERLGMGKIPASCDAALLEIWQATDRFGGLLDLEEDHVPSISALEEGLLRNGNPESDNKYTALCVAFVNFLCQDAFESSLDELEAAGLETREADYKPTARSQHPLPVTADSWPEAAARILCLHSVARSVDAVKAPGNPLAILDPQLALDILVPGIGYSLGARLAAIPAGASRHSRLARLAHADAALRAAAFGMVAPESADSHLKIGLRAIIQRLCSVKGASSLLFVGREAAAAAKSAKVVDLYSIFARVEAGYYEAIGRWSGDKYNSQANSVDVVASSSMETEEPSSADGTTSIAAGALDALEADVRTCCTTVLSTTGKHSDAARTLQHEGALEAAELVLSALDAAVAEVNNNKKSTIEEGLATLVAEISKHNSKISDLSAPFCPKTTTGCHVCWSGEDGASLNTCDGCETPYHMYCLPTPLEEAPAQGSWKCPACDSKAESAVPGEGRSKGPIETLCTEISSSNIWEWEPARRLALLQLLVKLALESRTMHAHLQEEEEANKQRRRDLYALRGEIKARQAEIKEAKPNNNVTGPNGGSSDGALGRSTRGADPQAQLEEAVRKVSRLEHQLAHSPGTRLVPVGQDRFWARYWLVSASALESQDDSIPDKKDDLVLVVDREEGDAAASDNQKLMVKHRWTAGIYRSHESLKGLLGWLNPKGVRERALIVEVKKLLQQQVVSKKTAMPTTKKDKEPTVVDADNGRSITVIDDEGWPSINLVSPTKNKTSCCSSIKELSAALLALHKSWPSHALLDDLAPPIDQWEAAVQAADSLATLAPLLLQLETWVKPEYLKPHWRFWDWPAVVGSNNATSAAMWMRLEALRLAVRTRTARGPAATLESVRPSSRASQSRYPQRERRTVKDAGVALLAGRRTWSFDENTDSANSSAISQPATNERSARLAKRQRAKELEHQTEAETAFAKVSRVAGGRVLRSKPAVEIAPGRLRDGGPARTRAAACKEETTDEESEEADEGSSFAEESEEPEAASNGGEESTNDDDDAME